MQTHHTILSLLLLPAAAVLAGDAKDPTAAADLSSHSAAVRRQAPPAADEMHPKRLS